MTTNDDVNEFDLEGLPEPSADAIACTEVLKIAAAQLEREQSKPQKAKPWPDALADQLHACDTLKDAVDQAAFALECQIIVIRDYFSLSEVAEALDAIQPGSMAVVPVHEGSNTLRRIEQCVLATTKADYTGYPLRLRVPDPRVAVVLKDADLVLAPLSSQVPRRKA